MASTTDYLEDMVRTLGGKTFTGCVYFVDTEQCKQAAAYIRSEFKVPARVVQIDGTTGLGQGYVGGRAAGPALFLPSDVAYGAQGWVSNDEDFWNQVNAADAWARALPGDDTFGKRYWACQNCDGKGEIPMLLGPIKCLECDGRGYTEKEQS
jgi:hypothetical protein